MGGMESKEQLLKTILNDISIICYFINIMLFYQYYVIYLRLHSTIQINTFYSEI